VNGELCGFSTQVVLDVVVDGRSGEAVYSGDTMIDPHYWGDAALTLVE
jgi:hypothetical protein